MSWCPICGRWYSGYPAISRKDNRTRICPECGIVEALKAGGMLPEDDDLQEQEEER